MGDAKEEDANKIKALEKQLEDAQKAAEKEKEEAKKKAEEEAKKKAEEDAKKKADEEAKKKAEDDKNAEKQRILDEKDEKEKEIETLNEKIRQLEKEGGDKDKEINNLKEQIKKLKEKIKNLEEDTPGKAKVDEKEETIQNDKNENKDTPGKAKVDEKEETIQNDKNENKEPETVCTQLEEGDNKLGNSQRCELTRYKCKNCGACDWSPTEKCKKQGKGTGEENRKISGTDFKTKLKNLGVDKDIQERWRIKLGFKAGRGSNDYPRDIECCVNSKKK